MRPRAATRNDPALVEELVRQYAPLACGLASKFFWHDEHELKSAALRGLLQAARTHHPVNGPFFAWARTKITFAIKEVFRTRSRVRGRDIMHLSLDAKLYEDDEETLGDTLFIEPEADTFDYRDSLHKVHECLMTLLKKRVVSTRDATILMAYLAEGGTKQDLAAEFLVTPARIGQIIELMAVRVRRYLENRTVTVPARWERKHLIPAAERRRIIRERLLKGEPPGKIAKSLGCAQRTLQEVARGLRGRMPEICECGRLFRHRGPCQRRRDAA